jgi:hypothetical protein
MRTAPPNAKRGVTVDFVPSDSDSIIDLYERNAHTYVADRRDAGWDESASLDRFIALLPQDMRNVALGGTFQGLTNAWN